jgi:hypothetical protein
LDAASRPELTTRPGDRTNLAVPPVELPSTTSSTPGAHEGMIEKVVYVSGFVQLGDHHGGLHRDRE